VGMVWGPDVLCCFSHLANLWNSSTVKEIFNFRATATPFGPLPSVPSLRHHLSHSRSILPNHIIQSATSNKTPPSQHQIPGEVGSQPQHPPTFNKPKPPPTSHTTYIHPPKTTPDKKQASNPHTASPPPNPPPHPYSNTYTTRPAAAQSSICPLARAVPPRPHTPDPSASQARGRWRGPVADRLLARLAR
jgi:cell wall-associated NlpC family hydrolase